jgi:MFS family permease
MSLMNLFSPNQLTEKLMPNGGFYNESTDIPITEPEKDPLEKFIDNLSAVIAGFANFAIQYNFQVMAIVLLTMSASVCTTDDDGCEKDVQELWVQTSVMGAVFLGCIVGMLTMGYIGDRVGRNNTMVLTMVIATIGALCSASFAFGSAEDIYGNIAICRFILGIGCGGVYPLSAAKAAEDAARHLVEDNRTVSIDIVAAAKAFFWQVPGVVSPWLVGYILTFSTLRINQKWRLLLGVGAIPLFIVMCLTLWEIYLRQHIVKVKTSNKVGCESVDSVQQALFASNRREEMIADPGYRKLLLCTSTCSFIFDMSYYGGKHTLTCILSTLKLIQYVCLVSICCALYL